MALPRLAAVEPRVAPAVRVAAPDLARQTKVSARQLQHVRGRRAGEDALDDVVVVRVAPGLALEYPRAGLRAEDVLAALALHDDGGVGVRRAVAEHELTQGAERDRR